METIIKKAIEGGYPDVLALYGTSDAMYRVTVCEPKFWQALGKACGWEMDKNIFGLGSDRLSKDEKNYSSFSFTGKRWIYCAMCFHEINLTEGWDRAVEWLGGVIEK